MSATHQQKDKKETSQQRTLTIMVLVVVSVFLLCNFADLIWWIWKSVANDNPPDILGCISIFTEMLHSCVNVIIYAAFGKQFRKTFFELFCSSCQAHDSEIGSEFPLRTNQTMKTDLPTHSTKFNSEV